MAEEGSIPSSNRGRMAQSDLTRPAWVRAQTVEKTDLFFIHIVVNGCHVRETLERSLSRHGSPFVFGLAHLHGTRGW